MRKAGSITDPTQAQRFGDYLLARGIKNRVDAPSDGGGIWIYEDSQLAEGKRELERFCNEPEHARYDRAGEADAIRKRERREQELAKQRYVDVRTTWVRRGQRRSGSMPLTLGLVFLCIGLFLLLQLAPRTVELARFYGALYIARAPGLLLYHLQEGEIWRLVTPILMHGSVLHLGFNMLWLYNLGGQIEQRRGKLPFVALVLCTAVFSNLTEYLWSGPAFLGMSGVVYALAGYVWMQARYGVPDLYLDKVNVVILVGWMFLCMTGLVGRVANAAHVGGLVAGLIAGSGPFLRHHLRR